MTSADYTVLTPERVALEYGVAGIGSRGGAAIIDTALQFLALFVLGVGILGSGAALANIPGAQAIEIAIGVLGLFVVTSGYFIVFEILWSGQTPGKRLLGLRVLRESGYPLRPTDAVIRNLVRIVDWLPVGYGVGVLVMLLNQRSKRLGDFAAGTLVVREGLPRQLSALQTHSVEAPTGVSLNAQDATLVRDFLVRRQEMVPPARAALARRLASALATRYAITLDASGDPEAFLERLTL